MNGNGWIKLHRSLLDSRLWSLPDATLRVALYLLLSANHTGGWFRGTRLERGQLVRSLASISAECSLSIKTVRGALQALVIDGFMQIDKPLGAQHGQRITISNYDIYQHDTSDTGTLGAHQGTRESTNEGFHEGISNKKGKKQSMQNQNSVPDKPPRARNPNLDALMLVESGTLDGVPQATWGKVAKALKTISEATPDVTPEEITQRAKNYRTHFDSAALTSTALASHWARCRSPPAVKPSTLPNTWNDPNTDQTIRKAF